jgi:excisionase family DNA binding protein
MSPDLSIEAVIAERVAERLRLEFAPIREALAALEARLPRELVPAPEYGKRTGLSRSSIARAIKSGDLPVVRIGRRVLIDASAVRPVQPGEISRLAREARSSR